MGLGRFLVTASGNDGGGVILLVDFDEGTYQPLLPYAGGICASSEYLWVARLDGERTRVEKYDRGGLVWMRRVRDCVDMHSLALLGQRLALCSTGTNEVIFLDDRGAEVDRWTPDAGSEGDSWHINSLVEHGGRLFVTCFGRFDGFRGWAGRLEGSGLLLEVGTGRTVLSGFSAPHDPRPVEGGWLVNDAARSRAVFAPDSGGPLEVLHETPGFARGLAVTADHLIIGSSAHRHSLRPTGRGSVTVVDRQSRRTIKTVALPYEEVGHIIPAPPDELIAAVRRDASAAAQGLARWAGPIPESSRAGRVEAVGEFRRMPDVPGTFELPVRLTNGGDRSWSSRDAPAVHVSYHLLDRNGDRLLVDGNRTPLPIPLQPERSLTFNLRVTFPAVESSGLQLLVTVVQESVAWWTATDRWLPLLLSAPGSDSTAGEWNV
jgi:hypothetical protein